MKNHLQANQYISQLFDVLLFAAEKHCNQCRKDDTTPYINHPIQVANLLTQYGEYDNALLAAALLHDTIEDTQTSASEIENLFGSEIKNIVLEVTDDTTLSKTKRKQQQILHAPQMSRKAKALKIADKICNVTDIVQCPPKYWTYERKIEYFDWACQVVDAMRGTNEQLELLFDKRIQTGLQKLQAQHIIHSS